MSIAGHEHKQNYCLALNVQLWYQALVVFIIPCGLGNDGMVKSVLLKVGTVERTGIFSSSLDQLFWLFDLLLRSRDPIFLFGS